MASLHEYYLKDFSRDLSIDRKWTFKDQSSGSELAGEVTARLHLDFTANAKYISFYVPSIEGVTLPEAILMNSIGEILEWPKTDVGVFLGFEGDQMDGRDLNFAGRVYFYSERPVPQDLPTQLHSEAKANGHHLVFRSVDYMQARNRSERPRAFICHDSRDKEQIAEPLALQLHQFMCPVWYDDFTLKVGDSLRESIEAGLKQCEKCI